MVSSLFAHLCKYLIWRTREVNNTIVWCEEFLVNTIPASLEEEHEGIFFLINSEPWGDHPSIFDWFNLQEYDSLFTKLCLQCLYTERKIRLNLNSVGSENKCSEHPKFQCTNFNQEKRSKSIAKIKNLLCLMRILEYSLPSMWLPKWETRIIDRLRREKTI